MNLQNYSHSPQAEFEKAIKNGTLSDDPKTGNYAGKYMFMGVQNGKAEFKNSCTREYL